MCRLNPSMLTAAGGGFQLTACNHPECQPGPACQSTSEGDAAKMLLSFDAGIKPPTAAPPAAVSVPSVRIEYNDTESVGLSTHASSQRSMEQRVPGARAHAICELKGVDLLAYVREHNNTLTFPEKLMLMLIYIEQLFAKSREGLDKAPINWVADGFAFCIRDEKKLCSKWLPVFFRQSKFPSFKRKLYRWGFRQVSVDGTESTKGCMFFGNENFQRNNTSLLSNMRSVTAAGRRREHAAKEVRKVFASGSGATKEGEEEQAGSPTAAVDSKPPAVIQAPMLAPPKPQQSASMPAPAAFSQPTQASGSPAAAPPVFSSVMSNDSSNGRGGSAGEPAPPIAQINIPMQAAARPKAAPPAMVPPQARPQQQQQQQQQQLQQALIAAQQLSQAEAANKRQEQQQQQMLNSFVQQFARQQQPAQVPAAPQQPDQNFLAALTKQLAQQQAPFADNKQQLLSNLARQLVQQQQQPAQQPQPVVQPAPQPQGNLLEQLLGGLQQKQQTSPAPPGVAAAPNTALGQLMEMTRISQQQKQQAPPHAPPPQVFHQASPPPAAGAQPQGVSHQQQHILELLRMSSTSTTTEQPVPPPPVAPPAPSQSQSLAIQQLIEAQRKTNEENRQLRAMVEMLLREKGTR